MQFDFVWTRNIETPHDRFKLRQSPLKVDEAGRVCVHSKIAFEMSQRSVQLADATNVQPSVQRKREANDWNQRGDDRNDKEDDAVKE